MKPAGVAFVFAGYTLGYFGWCSLRGPGVGLLDLVIPGRTVVLPGVQTSPYDTSMFGGGPPGSQIPFDPTSILTPGQLGLPQSAAGDIAAMYARTGGHPTASDVAALKAKYGVP